MLKELGISRITIPLPFRLNHVHCFLAGGAEGLTIMDTGLNTEITKEIWNPLITKHQIKNIFLTHYHPDHFGYAGTLQRLTGADVWMTRTDEMAGLTVWEPSSLEFTRRNYQTCGIPAGTADELTCNEGSFQMKVQPYPKVTHYFEEGMKVPFGKYEYEVIFTPGHSDGLICLYNREKNILFSTDHILPRISPNISYWFRGIPNPLGAFFTSLKKIQLLEADYVIPSHGEPFRNANKRIAELLEHHQMRLNEIYEFIRQPSTIYEVCNLLFKNLTAHEMRFAVGETLAHLEYLQIGGQCTKNLKDGVWFYEAI